MATTWGDPSTDTFRKKHIREARAAGGVALVNAQILSITARLLEGLSEEHVEIPEQVTSFDEAGTEHQRLGLALHLAIPTPPSAELGALADRWGFDGFGVENSDLVELRFTGTPADAQKLTDEALAMNFDRLESEDVSGPSPIRWPGARDLEQGDNGADVEFLRLLLNVEPKDAPVDVDLIAAVNRFMERRGAPVTNRIDVDFWRRLLPARRPLVSQGDSGFIVRVLQAAMAVYEGGTPKISGVWGVLTSRDVTALQKEYSLRGGSFVRQPEWALLLGPEIPRLEEARRAAQGIGVQSLPTPVDLTPSQAKISGRIGGYPTKRATGALGLVHHYPIGLQTAIDAHSVQELSIGGEDLENLIAEKAGEVVDDAKAPKTPVRKTASKPRTAASRAPKPKTS